MNVLIVDDQINVINGVQAGVDWHSLGVEQVFRAYNASEAREVFRQEAVDIMLCDIEMPAEDGLSLFRWALKEGYAVECIFLTAHAEFAYAQEAIHLGSFDYILQPAPYEEIQKAVHKAVSRIRMRREQQRNSRYGHYFQRNREALLDGVLRDAFLRERTEMKAVSKSLAQLGIDLDSDRRTVCMLLQLLPGGETEKWEEHELRYAMGNILAELLRGLGDDAPLLVGLGDGLYGVALPCAQAGGQELAGVMERFQRACREALGVQTACYLGSPRPFREFSHQAAGLRARMRDNVAYLEGVFGEDAAGEPEAEWLNAQFRSWEAALQSGGRSLTVRDEIHAVLNRLVEERRVNARVLKLFYQKLVCMFAQAAGRRGTGMEELLEEPELMDKYLTAYHSVDGLKMLADYVTPYFQDAEPEKNGRQIDQILQYIYNHIEQDIKRTDIAREVFLNPDYISRMFRREMGVSLKEFIVGEKMKAARDLLTQTALPVSAVALRVGYGNFSHFSHIYKKVMGVSPAEERREGRGSPENRQEKSDL